MGNLVKFGCPSCTSPHLRERDGKLHCISCDKWFEKDVETNEERDARILYLSRLDRAEELLRMSPPRFDDAEDHFRDFIKHYPNHSDGYWGLVRARYGIKYEDDVTGRKIPSCYKSSYKDFRKDSDFMKALSLAENDYIYDHLQEQAKLIANVCKEWREEAGKYNYDVFISFKDEDRGLGISDADRCEMTDLYYYLRDQGYKVFFSPKSMNEYTGKHYDAYIFNALQSAKAMIVYGSKPEYFTTTWVQNEWTRFLRMEANGSKKSGSCIVVYNGFSPYELPPDLRKIQAIDASQQKRFYGEVLNSIHGILADEKKPDENEELRKKVEALMRKQEELARQNEESQKRQEELQKSLEEEKKKNNVKQVEQKPSAPLVDEKEAPKAPNKTTKEKENPMIDPDFEIVDGCLVKYKGDKANVVIPDGVTSIGNNSLDCCESIVSILIPDSVTSIGNHTFYGCSNLKSVTVPNSITSIGNSAFRGCYSLENMTIKNSVTSIGEWAFYNCRSLTKVTISNNVTSIGKWTFAGCSSLKSVTIPNSVISIGKDAFFDCASLTSIVIPGSVISIGESAFSYCKNLTIWVHSLEQVKRWDAEWNRDNRPVKVVEAPKMQNKPKEDPDFEIKNGCLVKYKGDKRNVVIPDGVTCIGDLAFHDCHTIEYVTIPDSVTSIGDRAFQFSNLTGIVIPESVTSIGKYAFSSCPHLTIRVHSLDQVKQWDTTEWCSFGRPVQIEATDRHKKDPRFEIIGGRLVKYKGNETKVVIPNIVTDIGEEAFSGFSNLTSVTIPNGVTYIGEGAFRGCSSLTNITIPNSVTYIAIFAFDFCDSLTDVYYTGTKEEWSKIEIDCFDNTLENATIHFQSLAKKKNVAVDPDFEIKNGCLVKYKGNKEDVVIPDGVTSIGDYVFPFLLFHLKSVTIPNSVTYIGSNTLNPYSSLTSITVDKDNRNYKSIDGNLYTKDGTTLIQYAIGKKDTAFVIPDGVTSIGYRSFFDCTNLTSITIPDSVTSIGETAFAGCYSLTSIIIPKNVTSIGRMAFSGCKKLTIQVHSLEQVKKWDAEWNRDNHPVKVIGNMVTTKAAQKTDTKKVESKVTPKVKSSAINVSDPDFKIIGGCLKKYKGNKADVVIPNGVTSVGDSAFEKCSDLASVTIPSSVISIGNWAFSNCTNLTSIIIPNSVTSIGKMAFFACKKLTNVTIPDSVTSIEDWAFRWCSSLTSIIIPDNIVSIGKMAFSNCNLDAIISHSPNYLVKEGCLIENGTKVIAGTNKSDIPYGITTIDDGAFSGRKGLTDINIPDSVTSIGEEAFRFCSRLKNVTISDSVTSIGKNAFYSCYNLSSAIFKSSKKWIAKNILPIPVLFLNNTKIAAKHLTFTFVKHTWTKKK